MHIQREYFHITFTSAIDMPTYFRQSIKPLTNFWSLEAFSELNPESAARPCPAWIASSSKIQPLSFPIDIAIAGDALTRLINLEKQLGRDC